MNPRFPKAPFLVFPDRDGGFFVFEDPSAVFAGPELSAAEAMAGARAGWLAGGLQYARAEGPAPGWWGVFQAPRGVSRAELEGWADPGHVVTGPLMSRVSRTQYEQAYARVDQGLRSGHTYQVNLTILLDGVAVSPLAWSWRSALRLWLDLVAAQGREASFAVLGTPEVPGPVLVSASPELFFSQEGPVVEAKPMKGTGVRHADPAHDAASRRELETSAKTRAENLMVTDMLRNDLGRIAAPGGVTVPKLFEIEEYPTVWQMTSTVQARFAGEPPLSRVMNALFPCASITGAPKLSTQRLIDEAESVPRGWYTGTLGWHRPASPIDGPARSRFSVLIRTLVFADAASPRFTLGVGGGVVADSTVNGEWDEAWAKSRFLGVSQRPFFLTEAVLWTAAEGLVLLDQHALRLGTACRDFGVELEHAALQAGLEQEVARCRVVWGDVALKLRVLVDFQGHLGVEGAPLDELPDTLTCALAARPFGTESLLYRRYKTTARGIYDEARVPGVQQTIHFNERGELTESTSMNLILETGGRFLTPPLSSGLLDGTFRAQLLAEGTITEAILPVEALRAADQVWLVNSVRGWKRAVLVSPP